MPFLPALALLFIALKLMGYIAWSWWWVTAPLWAIPALLFGMLFGVFTFSVGTLGLATFIDSKTTKQLKR
jgi:hypothetical protein